MGIAYEMLGNCFVSAIDEQNPTDQEWATYLAHIRSAYLAYARSSVKPGLEPVALTSSRGGAPTPSQRSALVALTRELEFQETIKVAVLTESIVVRGISTALRWFHPHQRTFGPTDIEAALDFLGMSGAVAAQAKLTLSKVQERLR